MKFLLQHKNATKALFLINIIGHAISVIVVIVLLVMFFQSTHKPVTVMTPNGEVTQTVTEHRQAIREQMEQNHIEFEERKAAAEQRMNEVREQMAKMEANAGYELPEN